MALSSSVLYNIIYDAGRVNVKSALSGYGSPCRIRKNRCIGLLNATSNITSFLKVVVKLQSVMVSEVS